MILLVAKISYQLDNWFGNCQERTKILHRSTQTDTDRHIDTHRQTDTQTHINTHTHTDIHTHTHTQKHTQTHKHTQTQTHRHTYMDTDTRTHARIRTHTETHFPRKCRNKTKRDFDLVRMCVQFFCILSVICLNLYQYLVLCIFINCLQNKITKQKPISQFFRSFLLIWRQLSIKSSMYLVLQSPQASLFLFFRL